MGASRNAISGLVKFSVNWPGKLSGLVFTGAFEKQAPGTHTASKPRVPGPRMGVSGKHKLAIWLSSTVQYFENFCPKASIRLLYSFRTNFTIHEIAIPIVHQSQNWKEIPLLLIVPNVCQFLL